LFGLLNDFAPGYWWQHPDPEEWSPLEVVCHLRDSERAVQRPRLQSIAREDNPFLSEPKQPPGPGELGCDVVDLCDPAEQFAAERQETVAWLNGLPEAAWSRPARHSIFGPTTLLEMADFTATHDRLHLQQICQTLGRCE
ncbi:MAG: DinB family protein, partial [Anaerolineae bacterium]|nr:DinB family protein [Anaerolineae bacterium]